MVDLEKIISDIGDYISYIKNDYKKKYGLAILDIKIKKQTNGLIVSGFVLSKNQKDEIIHKINSRIDFEIAYDIKVLGDIKNSELGWAEVKKVGTIMKQRFVSNDIINEKILKRINLFELEEGQVLRVLFEWEDQFLVQDSYLALGWVDKKDVVFEKKSLRDRWKENIFIEEENIILVKDISKKITSEANKFLGVRYLWGRRSLKGLDCSALTQLVYKNAFNIILPRHSWDQRRMGVSVKLDEASTGDLVFMLNLKNYRRHVGILDLESKEKKIIHACLSEKKVVRQNIEEVLKNYEIVEIKKIVAEKE